MVVCKQRCSICEGQGVVGQCPPVLIYDVSRLGLTQQDKECRGDEGKVSLPIVSKSSRFLFEGAHGHILSHCSNALGEGRSFLFVIGLDIQIHEILECQLFFTELS